MSRASRLLLPVLVLSGAMLSGCGQAEATRDSIRDRMEQGLLAVDVGGEEAAGIAGCVADGMFESGDWTPEERNAATRAVDGTEVDPDLTAKLNGLLDSCDALVVLQGDAASAEPDAADPDTTVEGDDDATTTTAGDEGSDDTTTTTE
ncbi:MAG: hypothetical protein H0W25_03245 [Acidimicrobiia bacterium]|nr:hypothetical protein [Acidimicrobiia bacterium]